MRTDALQLLRRLEPVVRPTSVQSSVNARASIDRAGFDDLLARAEQGEFESGRPIDDGILEEPLEESIRDRVGRIADAAEAAGHERILVIAEDRPILIGVSNRRVDGELGRPTGTGEPDENLRPIDAAVRLIPADHEPTISISGPSARTMPPAIAEAILAGGDPDATNRLATDPSPNDARDDAA